MGTPSPRDLHLVDDRWEPVQDVLTDCPDGSDVAEFLATQGWRPFLTVGDSDLGELCLISWERDRDHDGPAYLLQVSSLSPTSPFLLVDTFAGLMDLFARWAPAVQAAAISQVVRDLNEAPARVAGHPVGGLVENVATRIEAALRFPR